MKVNDIICIRPLSKKMRDKVREFGNAWKVSQFGLLSNNTISIETLCAVHHGKHPYSRWVVIGTDVEIVNCECVKELLKVKSRARHKNLIK